MRCQKVRDGIIIDTGKPVTTASGVLAIKANAQQRTINLETEIMGQQGERFKISLLHKTSYFLPTTFGESFFKLFDLDHEI